MHRRWTHPNRRRIRHQRLYRKNIYTIAGNGTNGFSGDDGPAIEAELNSPSGVAVDQNGNSILPTPQQTVFAL